MISHTLSSCKRIVSVEIQKEIFLSVRTYESTKWCCAFSSARTNVYEELRTVVLSDLWKFSKNQSGKFFKPSEIQSRAAPSTSTYSFIWSDTLQGKTSLMMRSKLNINMVSTTSSKLLWQLDIEACTQTKQVLREWWQLRWKIGYIAVNNL